MKRVNLIKTVLIFVLAFGFIGCSNDDNDASIDYAREMVNTTWKWEGTISSGGNDYNGTLQLNFKANAKGSLKTNTRGSNSSATLEDSFSYSMSSAVEGIINFDDTSIETMSFNISNNQLTFNGKIYTKE
ncbi:hypothetical protein LNI90_11435 [Tenacibaculum dicentrarchi]|nr:hypothetical protein [Tenacibaculum dicentrarchi]MCD8452694.1 hypothetical protein [Tenacibaculum dicentrarchi]WBX67968.1 hypothetical protein PG910_07480 [Tenacibaculum dicentrarchi]